MLWKRMPRPDISSPPPFSHLVPLSSTPRTNWVPLILPHIDWSLLQFTWIIVILGFPGGSVVKNLLQCRRWEFRSLGQEDPLEKGMATHSSILAWEIPWTKEPGGLQSMGLQRVGHDWVTKQQQTIVLVKVLTIALESPNSNTKESF